VPLITPQKSRIEIPLALEVRNRYLTCSKFRANWWHKASIPWRRLNPSRSCPVKKTS